MPAPSPRAPRLVQAACPDLAILGVLCLMAFGTDTLDFFHIAFLLLVVEAFLVSHWAFWPRLIAIFGVTEILIVRAGDPPWNDLAEPVVLATIAAIVFVMHRSRDRARSELHEHATKDSLTGLLNRRALQNEMDHAVKRLHRDRTPFTVIYVDLDGFKSVNDTFGHDVGDLVLSETATRIKALAGAGGHAGRIGGDEFALLLRSAEASGWAEHVADQLLAELERPFLVGGERVMISASLGIAMASPTNQKTPQELLSDADRAMYSVKRGAKGTYAFAG